MKKLAISVLVLSSAAAFAGTADLSRAGVIDAAPLQPQAALVTNLSRADVTAEYIRDRNQGTLAIVGDTAPLQSQALSQGVSRDRDTVKAEAVQASRAYVYHEL